MEGPGSFLSPLKIRGQLMKRKWILSILMIILASSNLAAQQTVTKTVTLNPTYKTGIVKIPTRTGDIYNQTANPDIGSSLVQVTTYDTTETARSYFIFNIKDIAHANQVSIETVKLNYTASGCGSCTFKITGPTSVVTGQYEADWKAIGNANTKEGGILYGSNSITFSGIKDYMTSQLSTDQLILGAASENEGNPGSAVGISINLTVTYTYQAYSMTAQNDFDGLSQGGQIGVGVDTNATSRTSPYPFHAINGDSIHLAAYDHQNADNYEWVFNNTEAPDNKSEWTIREGGKTKPLSSSQTTTYTTNNDQNAVIADKQKELYHILRKDQTLFGTSSAGMVAKVVKGNTDSLSAPASKTQNGKTLLFAGWKDLPNGLYSTNPRAITPTDNTTYTVLYKGHQISNDANAYSGNSQRRLIETESGGTTWLSQVYTSMGYVWIEHSSDGGQTWTIGNNGNPLGTGKNPSIAFTTDTTPYNYIGVIWQAPSGSHYVIKGQTFNQSQNMSMVPRIL